MASKTIFFVAVILLFLAGLTASQAVITYTDMNITVRDISTNEAVGSQALDLTFTNVNSGTTINLTEFTDKNGFFAYRLNVGNWRLVAKMDNPLTPEIDYSAERTFLVEENNPTTEETIYLVPVGSLEGNVINPSGKLINNAELTYKCRSYKTASKTDQYGSFRQDLLPVGQCKVQAAFSDLVGSSLVNISQGELSQTTIHLNRTVFSASKKYIYVILGIAAVAILIFFVYKMTRKKFMAVAKKEVKKEKKVAEKAHAKTVPESIPEEKKEELAKEVKEINPRARDIIKTLNEREKKVVDFMLTQKDHKSTQANIRNETGIPKTSIVRVFQSLEAKNVLKVEVVGKLKKVELTGWFLGKD